MIQYTKSIHQSGKRKRMKFSPEEDKMLKELVKKYGDNNWVRVSELMPGRNVRQCRERWKHYLCNDNNNRDWTKEEDQIMLTKYIEFGQRWTKIAAYLPGRTDIQVKTRCLKLLRLGTYANELLSKEIQVLQIDSIAIPEKPERKDANLVTTFDLPADSVYEYNWHIDNGSQNDFSDFYF